MGDEMAGLADSNPSSTLVDWWREQPEAPNGMPGHIKSLCSVICAMEIGLRDEEFTHTEAVQLICAWLQGGCPR
jgi:hypothetical protein